MNESTYKGRAPPEPIKGMDLLNEGHLHLGTSGTCGPLIMCPALERYLGEQLHLESLAANERRKAAEERSGAGAKQ